MIMSCWAMPKAKAVVSETALLGSIFGSLLVSLGYSWAADNMDAPTFGESIYKLTQEFDEAMKDTGNQLIRDLNLAGVVATGAGKLQFGYAWVQAARSFAAWFQSKFFVGENTSAVVLAGSGSTITTKDGISIALSTINDFNSDWGSYWSKDFILGSDLIEIFDVDISSLTSDYQCYPLTDTISFAFKLDFGRVATYWYDGTSYHSLYAFPYAECKEKSTYPVFVLFPDNKLGIACYRGENWKPTSEQNTLYYQPMIMVGEDVLSVTDLGLVENPALSAEKPQEVHYPDVAEDGSQVYEITVDGVTATDIEGIIQGAVDQILAGTAAIAGEVTQAQDVPADPEVPPELDGLDLPALGAALTTRFPFSIPWDVARGIQMLAAPAEAPYWEVDFLAPLGYRVGGWKGSTLVVLDFSEFEIIGQVTRWMSTIGFCLMLASSTKRLIWVA